MWLVPLRSEQYEWTIRSVFLVNTDLKEFFPLQELILELPITRTLKNLNINIFFQVNKSFILNISIIK